MTLANHRIRPAQLERFMRESLHIEGIEREPTFEELNATAAFLRLSVLTVSAVEELVSVYAPRHRLRDAIGLDVRVGPYIAPRGCPEIRDRLADILQQIGELDAWEIHCRYEVLHPFTDGNGRSGRAIWLWQMDGIAPLGFLHMFYYQTLQHQR